MNSRKKPAEHKDLPFSIGSPVTVRSLKKNGVIAEILSNERYRVTLGSLTLVCPASNLEARSVSPTRVVAPPRLKKPQFSPPTQTLDLHGLRVHDALIKLETWLDRVILAEMPRVTIIHGHGTGAIQRAVHGYLESMKLVSRFQINPFNSGETIVYTAHD
jgi:DNA mismatch repair protein MutS2